MTDRVLSSRRNRCAALAICAAVLALAPLGAASVGRDQLRIIVQELCVPHWVQTHDPAPCASVSTDTAGRAPDGFAVLADIKGGAHFLLIPTRTISGIESPEARSAGAPNYFDAAWKARDLLASVLGHSVPRAAVGLAVNHLKARSQDQLHIHISCLRPAVYNALEAQGEQIGAEWSAISIGGSRYQSLRVMGLELGAVNPFELLAARLPGARDAMGEFTVLVAGMEFKAGSGFVILAGTAVPGAELLLDARCAVAG
jgi:CDP-diacylglycerol pyrophosphatase